MLPEEIKVGTEIYCRVGEQDIAKIVKVNRNGAKIVFIDGSYGYWTTSVICEFFRLLTNDEKIRLL